MSNGEVLVLGSRGEDFDETLQFCFVVERHTEEFWRGREGGREGGREEKGERGRRGGGEREERGRREGERQEEERKKNRESGMKEG